MNDVPRIVITGANGFLGAHLVRHFSRKGWTVVAVTHRPCVLFSEDVECWRWDITEPPADQMLAGADYLLHCAYVRHERDPQSDRTNIEGARNLLDLSRRYGVRRNVFMSSMSADASALSHYGRQKHQIEQLFCSPTDTVLRLGLVLGSGGLFRELAEFIRKVRVVPLVDGGRQPLQTIHIDDFMAAVDAVLERNLSGVFSLAEPQPVLYRDFYRGVANVLGIKASFIPVPSWLLWAAIGIADVIGIRLPVSRENLLGLRNLKFINVSEDIQILRIDVRPWFASLQAVCAPHTVAVDDLA